MKNLFTIILFLLPALIQSQEAETIPANPIEVDIRLLIPEVTIDVDVMGNLRMDPGYELLYNKFAMALQQNIAWYQEQLKIAEQTGQYPVPYDPRMGLTKEEYDTLLVLVKSGPGVEAVKSGTERVTFHYDGPALSFYGTGDLSVFGTIVVRLDSNIAWIAGKKLDQYNAINVTDANNAFRTTWSGHGWRYEYSSKPDADDLSQILDDVGSLDLVIYRLTIGRLSDSGKTLIEISLGETHGGKKTVAYQLPFVFLP